MNEPSPGEETFRHFLLGRVDDAQREGVERLFLTDAHYKERLLAAEQSLIDDYLEERLTTEEKKSFLLRFAATPDQRRKLRIAKSIKDHAEAQVALRPVATSEGTRIFGLQAKWRRILPIAAVVIVAFILMVWVLGRQDKSRPEHLAIENELATLNEPSKLRATLPQMAALSLAPITLRNVEMQARFSLRSDIKVLEVHLLLVSNERHEKYRLILQKDGNREQFTFPELSVEPDNPHVLRVRIPTSILSPGNYKIRLRNTAADGDVSSLEEYNFTITA